ncbi:MAG TPA: AraC family transcriptional regulator [Sphingobium sp.]
MLHRFPAPNPAGLTELTYFPPPATLRDSFGPAYLFTADHPVISDITRADFPQLRFMLKGMGDYHFHDGSSARTPECCLLGPTLGATRMIVDGPLQAFGVSILPVGWMGLGLQDADKLADSVADMTAIFGPETEALLTRFRVLDDPAQAADMLWLFLEALLKPVPPSVGAFVTLCDAWLAGESSPRVETLVEATGLSARQAARLANRLYGAPPKYLARKFRALRCAAELGLDHQGWMEMVEDSFYDQSHFIREIKHFIGFTPHQLKTDPSPVARLTLQRRAMIGAVAEINRIS